MPRRPRGLALLGLALLDAFERLGDLAVLRRAGRDARLQRGEIVAQLVGGGAQLRDGVLQRLHLVGDLLLGDRRDRGRRGRYHRAELGDAERSADRAEARRDGDAGGEQREARVARLRGRCGHRLRLLERDDDRARLGELRRRRQGRRLRSSTARSSALPPLRALLSRLRARGPRARAFRLSPRPSISGFAASISGLAASGAAG